MIDMFAIADAVRAGRYFWAEMTNAWPLPFQLEGDGAAILLDEHGSGFSIAIVFSQELGLEERLRVQISDEASALLEVVVTREREFIWGVHQGHAVDEASAVEAMLLYHSRIHGQWTHEDGGAHVGEGEHD